MISTIEIATALGRDQPEVGSAERAQWDMWIGDARFLIGNRLGDLALLDQAALDYVVREAVVAMVRRPDDATQVDISVDDGRVSKIYQSSPGKVFIRQEWWDLLTPGSAAGGALSVRPGFESDEPVVCRW